MRHICAYVMAVSAVLDKGFRIAREAGTVREARLAERSKDLDRQGDAAAHALRNEPGA